MHFRGWSDGKVAQFYHSVQRGGVGRTTGVTSKRVPGMCSPTYPLPCHGSTFELRPTHTNGWFAQPSICHLRGQAPRPNPRPSISQERLPKIRKDSSSLKAFKVVVRTLPCYG